MASMTPPTSRPQRPSSPTSPHHTPSSPSSLRQRPSSPASLLPEQSPPSSPDQKPSTSSSPTASSDPGQYEKFTDQQLLEVKSWLLNNTKEQQIWAEAEKVVLPPSDADVEKEISKLIVMLQEKATVNSRREFTMEQIQLGNVIMKSVYENDDPANSSFSRRLKKMMGKHRQQTAEILKTHKELAALQAELDDLKDENRKLMRENRQQMSYLDGTNKNLQTTKKQFDSKKEESLILEELQSKRNQNKAIRYIFQSLIIASGVNWTEDQELLDTMIQLGMELED